MVRVVWCAILATMASVSASVTLDALMVGSTCGSAPAGWVACSVSGDMQLTSVSAVSGNISVFGMNAAVLHLVPSGPLVLKPGSALSLSNLAVSSASFAGAPDPRSPLSVAFIQLSGISVQRGSSLRLLNLSVLLDCADWASLFDVFCGQGYANGIVKVLSCSHACFF